MWGRSEEAALLALRIRLPCSSQQLIVQMDLGQFFILEMYTPCAITTKPVRVFDAMAGLRLKCMIPGRIAEDKAWRCGCCWGKSGWNQAGRRTDEAETEQPAAGFPDEVGK